MSKLLLLFLLCAVPMETRTSATYSRGCPTPYLQNGRAKVRTRTRSAVIFECNPHFKLVGSRYATCRHGMEWDEPTPFCVRPGCHQPTMKNPNTIAISSHDDAWYMFVCYPGHKLIGSPTIYCDGREWNATVPTCAPDDSTPNKTQTSCDFESPNLCGWRQDELHDFDWYRHNQNTPSSFLYTGPSYDHTFGKGKYGYYMYIESTSKRNNDSARLISPVFDASLTKNGCFSFFYHMLGRTIGGLRVYQVADNQHILNLTEAERPDLLLFEKWGEQGNFWFRNVSKLREMNSDFQIVIEGIRGSSFTSDIAIDDVAILQGEQCVDAAATAVTPATFADSCAGRCDLYGSPALERGCGCTVSCVTKGNCCADFFDACVFAPTSKGNATDGDSDDDSPEAPRTEKLIGSSAATTTTRPSTTRRATTKAVRTTAAVAITTTAPTTTTTKPTTTTKATTKASKPLTTVKTVKTTLPRLKSTVRFPTTKVLTTRLTTVYVVPKTTKRQNTSTSWTKLEADKARKEKEIEAKKVVTAKPQASRSPAALVLTTVALAALLAAAALVALRSARGRAALARLRGRVAGDPEVRYLTRDDD